jgi:hypothetical protein
MTQRFVDLVNFDGQTLTESIGLAGDPRCTALCWSLFAGVQQCYMDGQCLLRLGKRHLDCFMRFCIQLVTWSTDSQTHPTRVSTHSGNHTAPPTANHSWVNKFKCNRMHAFSPSQYASGTTFRKIWTRQGRAWRKKKQLPLHPRTTVKQPCRLKYCRLLL